MSGVRIGIVADLWRFPVKSLGGERARRLFVGPYGIQGDRTHAVIAPDGSLVTARRATRMLAFRARHRDAEASRDVTVTTPAGVDLAVDDPLLGHELSEQLGREVALARSPVGVFDAAPLHIVTTASVNQVGDWVGGELDACRFRANIVLELEYPDAFSEAGWVDAVVAFGDGPVAQVVSPTERCAVTTVDPVTLERNNGVLAALAQRRENLFGVYANVAAPGWVHVGDEVTLLPGEDAAI